MTKHYKRIISIGAHPLDAELMGGPFCLYEQHYGAQCTMVHVTTGRLEKKDASKVEKEAYLQSLHQQIQVVASTMNCDVYQMNYVSSDMPTMQEFIATIKAYLKKKKADMVITHHIGTLHERHYYTHKGVLEAVKSLRFEGYDIDLLYGENLEDLVGFIPTKYVQLSSSDVHTWFQALQHYDLYNGGINIVPYDDYYRTMGKVRSLEAGCSGFVKAYMHAGLIEYSKK